MPDTIALEQANGVLTITLNRPDVLNAVNDLLGKELQDAPPRGGGPARARCPPALAAVPRWATDRASFIELFSRIGLVPDSGSTWFLPHLVGLGKALEMTYTADPVDASQAPRLGLVNRVVPHEGLIS